MPETVGRTWCQWFKKTYRVLSQKERLVQEGSRRGQKQAAHLSSSVFRIKTAGEQLLSMAGERRNALRFNPGQRLGETQRF